MTRKRVRIDVEDDEGTRYKLDLEGKITRDKVIKVFELMDLINIEENDEAPNLDSVGAKIWNIIDKNFPLGRFTSSEVLEKYEDEYNEPIKLSIISTYLARFALKSRVERAKHGREWTYQIIKIHQKQPH